MIGMTLEQIIDSLVKSGHLIEKEEMGNKYYKVTPSGAKMIVDESVRAVNAMCKCPHLMLNAPFNVAVSNFIKRMQDEYKGSVGALLFLYQQSKQSDAELQASVDFDATKDDGN